MAKRRRKRRDEEPLDDDEDDDLQDDEGEEDDDDEEEEEEVEEEERPRRKKRGKGKGSKEKSRTSRTSRKKSRREVDDDPDDDDSDDDSDEEDVPTPGRVKGLLDNPDEIPAAKAYQMKLVKASYRSPTSDKRGGYMVSFKVTDIPVDVDLDDDEAKEVKSKRPMVMFPVYKDPTEGQATNQRFAEGDLNRLIIALGDSVDGERTYSHILKDNIGGEILVDVTHRHDDGRTYQDLKNFRPVDEEDD